MILGKIVAGALAIVWDIESAFVQVDLGSATVNRTSHACTSVATNATLTNCGQTLSDALVNLTLSGVSLLNNLVQGLSVSGNVR